MTYRDGILYALRAGSKTIDLIDSSNGTIIKSIETPAKDDFERAGPRLISTESHLFYSGADETFAISLAKEGNPVVWQVPIGGKLAITPNNILVISGDTDLHAYKLF